LRNQERIDHWTPRMAALREDFDEAVRTYFSWETETYVETELRKYAGWTEAEATANIEHSFGGRICTQPNSWDDNAFNHPAQPVVGVSLFEAQAYCRWLAAMTGRPLRLPTEAEWEVAARGRQGRRWPWPSDSDPDRWQINADPAHLRRTSPVGVFPASDSPEGLCDLSGNVLEWTESLYTDRLEREALTTIEADFNARRAVRGGAWDYHTVDCRAGCRNRDAPDFRNISLGFRAACCHIPGPPAGTQALGRQGGNARRPRLAGSACGPPATAGRTAVVGQRRRDAQRQCVGGHGVLHIEDDGPLPFEPQVPREHRPERFDQAGAAVEVDRVLHRRRLLPAEAQRAAAAALRREVGRLAPLQRLFERADARRLGSGLEDQLTQVHQRAPDVGRERRKGLRHCCVVERPHRHLLRVCPANGPAGAARLPACAAGLPR
jgi:hypothetical protein